MITIEQIKEYIKCPQFGDKDYGKWGALRPEQREAYRRLIDIIEGMEEEIERLVKLKEQELRASNNSYDKIYRCRYIDKLTIEKTARLSNYSRSQVFNILKEIRKHLK